MTNQLDEYDNKTDDINYGYKGSSSANCKISSTFSLADSTETESVSSIASSCDCESPSHTAASTRTFITFGNVSVRRYSLTVGDHPECRVGPPITLDWKYYDNEEITSIDHYEKNRGGTEPRRLLSSQRRKLLHEEFGVSEEDIANSQKEVHIIRENRVESIESKQYKKKTNRIKSLIKSVGRKTRNLLIHHQEGSSHFDGNFSGTSLIVPFSY
jgi:hypothetical protein